MTNTVTRDEYRVDQHAASYPEWGLLTVWYKAKGISERLEIYQLIDPRGVNDQAVIDALLERSDEEAQWYADHCDQVGRE